MSVIPPENPRYEDQIVISAIVERQVANPRQPGTTQPIFDVKTADNRVLSTFKKELALQAYNLGINPQNGQPTGATLRVQYTSKPARDPQYPPNLTLELIEPTTVAPAAQPLAPAGTFTPTQPTLPIAQPVQTSTATVIPQSSSGPSEDDKVHMRRSAAIKAAAVYCAGTGEDLWKTAHEMMIYIETGTDPVPFDGGGEYGG